MLKFGKGRKPKKPSKLNKAVKATKLEVAKGNLINAKESLKKLKRDAQLAKAEHKSKIAQEKFKAKSYKKYGMDSSKINEFEAVEKIKTKEQAKRDYNKAAASVVRQAPLYSSINNAVDGIFNDDEETRGH